MKAVCMPDNDLALADELGVNRKNIARSTERLVEEKSIGILEIPEDLTAFSESHGASVELSFFRSPGVSRAAFWRKIRKIRPC
jgi:predicted glycosyltransferase